MDLEEAIVLSMWYLGKAYALSWCVGLLGWPFEKRARYLVARAKNEPISENIEPVYCNKLVHFLLSPFDPTY